MPASTGSIRSIRPPRRGMRRRGAAPHRALSRHALSHRLFLRQRGRLVERRAVPVLLREAGGELHQAALGGAAAPALSRRLAALHRRFRAAARASRRGTALLRAEAATRLRPGGNGSARCGAGPRAVAEHYYALAARGDPRAPIPARSIFGDRLPIYYDPGRGARRGAPCRRASPSTTMSTAPKAGSRPISSTGCGALSGGKPVLGLGMVLCRAREPHRQPQQRPSDDGRDARPSAPRARPRRPRNFAARARARRPRLVPVLRLSAGRPRRPRGLRFRPRRHRRPAL